MQDRDDIERKLVASEPNVPQVRNDVARVILTQAPSIDRELEEMITILYHRYITHVSGYVARGILTVEGEDLVCIGIDGQKYLAPTWGQIITGIRANPWLIEKVKEGFSDILPVPFASSLADKAARFRAVMQTNERYPISSAQLAAPQLGIFDDHTEEFIYFPKKLNSVDHGGMTKKQYLSATHKGWQVVLVNSQDQNGPGIYVNRSAQSFLDELQTATEKKNEIPMDLDTYLVYASALWARGIAVDDLNYKVKGKLTVCAGTLHLAGAQVAAAGWNHIQRKVAIVPASSQTILPNRVLRTCVPILQ